MTILKTIIINSILNSFLFVLTSYTLPPLHKKYNWHINLNFLCYIVSVVLGDIFAVIFM